MNISIVNHNFKSALRKRNITRKIILHHQAGSSTTASHIHQMHLSRGWLGIGYHYYIRMNGMIETGRPDDTVGAHAGASANGDSIAICLAGNFDTHYPSEEQLMSLVWLIRDHIFRKYGELEVSGHKDHMSTSCPGKNFPMTKIKEAIKVGQDKLMLNGVLVTAPVKNENGRLHVLLNGVGHERHWVEVRALADLLGAKLEWDAKTRTAFLNVASR